jgi:hypothetical protein
LMHGGSIASGVGLENALHDHSEGGCHEKWVVESGFRRCSRVRKWRRFDLGRRSDPSPPKARRGPLKAITVSLPCCESRVWLLALSRWRAVADLQGGVQP